MPATSLQLRRYSGTGRVLPRHRKRTAAAFLQPKVGSPPPSFSERNVPRVSALWTSSQCYLGCLPILPELSTRGWRRASANGNLQHRTAPGAGFYPTHPVCSTADHSVIQGFPHLFGQILEGERLLDEMNAFVQHPMMGDYIGSISGHVQAFEGRIKPD